MDALIDLSWRVYPASVMMAGGIAVFVCGAYMLCYALGLRLSDHPDKMQTFMRGFRVAVIGLTFAGVGASWNWHITWLFVLSLIVFGEEVMETTTHLYILRRKWGAAAGVR